MNDLNNLRSGSAQSLQELREFLANLKGRRPQEVIGIVSASMLMQSMVLATIAVAALLCLFTLGPYIVYGPPQAKPDAPKPKVVEPAVVSDQAAPVAEAKEPVAEQQATVDVEKATKVMGLDETKSADPETNPLDGPNLDNLLDKLDP